MTGPCVGGAETGPAATVTDRLVIAPACPRLEPRGVPLADAKPTRTALQPRLVAPPTVAVVAAPAQGDRWGQARGVHGSHPRTFRPRVGPMPLTTPRRSHGRCPRRQTPTFRPLHVLLTDVVAPARRCRATTGAARVSYGLTAPALTDCRPVDATLTATTVQPHPLPVAHRGDDERGEAPGALVEGCPADGGRVPMPEGPSTVGNAGRSGRDGAEPQGHCDVSVGQRLRALRRVAAAERPSRRCWGVVQTWETTPQRRLFEGPPRKAIP